jgi:hypothetical protein
MVYCDIANSRNAVTAFVVCLLFSFQRPSSETLDLERNAPSQARPPRKSRRPPFCVKEEVDLRPSPGTVKKVRSRLSALGPSQLRGSPSTANLAAPSRGLYRNRLGCGVPLGWGLLLLPPRSPVKEKAGTVLRLLPAPPSLRGAASNPWRTASSTSFSGRAFGSEPEGVVVEGA